VYCAYIAAPVAPGVSAEERVSAAQRRSSKSTPTAKNVVCSEIDPDWRVQRYKDELRRALAAPDALSADFCHRKGSLASLEQHLSNCDANCNASAPKVIVVAPSLHAS
jgi:hypothetical protein